MTDELGWDEVSARFAAAANWWVSTQSAETGPHAVPVWGVVLDATLVFFGEAAFRRSRNLAVDARAVLHLEGGSDVVIVHATVSDIGLARAHRRACALFAEKYTDPADLAWLPDAEGMEETLLWQATPTRALAWTLYGPDSMAMRRWSPSP